MIAGELPDESVSRPTGATVRSLRAVTANRTLIRPGFGLAMTLQLVPSQCSIRAKKESRSTSPPFPTAPTLVGDSALIPAALTPVWGLMRLQLVPFQCRTAGPVKAAGAYTPAEPTAQTSLRASPEIASMFTPLNAGLEMILQLLPSQCSTKAATGAPEESSTFPAAQTSFDETAVTPSNSPPFLGVGLATTRQLLPFQCSIKVLSEPPLPNRIPTAHTSLLATPATPDRLSLLKEGVGTMLRCVPSKCSATG